MTYAKKLQMKSLKHRPYHPRIPLDCSLVGSLSIEIKLIWKGLDNFKYLLGATCEITYFILSMAIKSGMVHVITEFHGVIYIFGPPKPLVMNKGKAFTGEVIQVILEAINC